MNDVLQLYPDPETLLERLEEYTKVDDPEASELYKEAGRHFSNYAQLLDTDQSRLERHKAGYELEACEMYLDQAMDVLTIRSKQEVVGELE